MGIFENCLVVLELKNLPYKEKERYKSVLLDNGAKISFVVNKQCSLVVTTDVSCLSSSRLRSVQKHKIPVVGLDYVLRCSQMGARQPVELFRLEIPSSVSSPPRLKPPTQRDFAPDSPAEENIQSGNVLEKFRIYAGTDFNLPKFPDHFEVAKYTIFEKNNSWCVLELQSVSVDQRRRYRVVKYCMDLAEAKKAAVKDQLVFLSTSEDALDVYKALRDSMEMSGLQIRPSMSPQIQDLGSAPLQQLLLEERLNTASVSQEVGAFVELLWTEALGRLSNVLLVSIDKLSLNDVSRAEGLLLQAQRKLKDGDPFEAGSLLKEVYTLLPHREPRPPVPSASLLSQKLDLCQLIRDVLNVSEMTLRSSTPTSVGKYRALRCGVEVVPPSSSEFEDVARLLQHSSLQIHQIVRVSRRAELQTFNAELGNTRALLHSSGPSNFVGILSRGLLLPRVGVELHGIQRTDVGNLGSGIYFSDSLSTSLKYSKPSETDGSRLLLVCDVALGNCKDVRQRDPTLTHAPLGHHSVHGIRRTQISQSDFEDDEFVVYSPDQVKLKYVVRYSVDGEQLKEFRPTVDTSATELDQRSQELGPDEEQAENVKNPREDVKAGLQDSSGLQLPLQSIHVKCKLIDLLSQVIVFQKYTNLSTVPIEAKYVFPLGNSATVCGFEAFINGKHVVGQVKEKETARKEYRQAVEKGHGAYLMDQDAPDVFTISVGNLPPGATVLIKVTYVSELVVSEGRIHFSLPGSVAPWQESDGLNQTTQVSVEKVCVTDKSQSSREFSLDMSVEMPNEIVYLKSNTHQIKTKRTDCKAVISVVPGQPLHPYGFDLDIGFSDVHLPRMWVENHPDKDSQACMLVFYPDFEVSSGSAAEEVILLLDTSESMRGESLRSAQRIALQLLHRLNRDFRLNVILFGSDHKEAFLKAQPVSEVLQDAESFIKSGSLVGGGTELWRPLRALGLLPPSRGVRNLLLLSDGHIQNPELTLQLLRDGAAHSRLFTCGLSSTANRHMLRALAQAGGGAYEFFDPKTKHSWEEKMLRHVDRMRSPGCTSVSVKWQQFSSVVPPPVQAPVELSALFNNCHTLVYGFVAHCTQATLLGNLCGEELKTLVSTSELQKTRGTFLHKLTARAIIRDYEDGNLDSSEAEHEGKKEELKSFIIELSKEYSILSQFTSFVAIEERDSEQPEDGFTDIPKLIAEEDVDFLPYVSWTIDAPTQSCASKRAEHQDEESSSGEDMGNGWDEFESCTADGDQMEHDEESSSGEDMGNFLFEDDADICHAFPLRRRAKRAQHQCLMEPPPGPVFLKGPPQQCLMEPPPGPVFLKGPPPGAAPAADFTFGKASASGPPPLPVFSQGPPLASAAVADFTFGKPYASLYGTVGSPLNVSFSRRAQVSEVDVYPALMPEFCLSSFSVDALRPYSDALPPPPPPCHEPAYAPTAPGAVLFDGPAEFEFNEELDVGDSITEVHGLFGAMSSPRPAALSIPAEAPTDDQEPRSFGTEARLIRRSMSRSAPRSFLRGRRPPDHPSLMLASPEASQLPAHHQGFALQSADFSPAGLRWLSSRFSVDPKRKWTRIFQLQQQEGFWELTSELGHLLNLNVDVFVNVFLKSKGIKSLGPKAHGDILRMLATLLVLQLMRVENVEEGKLLRSLFHLEDSQPRLDRWEAVKKAVDWVCWADRQYPCIYSRLEFGRSWESSTRQLLGFDSLPLYSPLIGLNLRETPTPVLVQ
ncbi:protein mono-ADP-ribosyltransferase PARP4 isoform X5 [Oryzias latipes]